jgi:hypothetical protein
MKTVSLDNHYTVKKDGAQWVVVSTYTGQVQFRSLMKARCADWIKLQTPQQDNA